MKAPDKVYVREFAEGLSQMWSGIKATETSATAQHEYIRKDALMEWAKDKQYESLTIVADNFWQEVIDKLNSL